MLNHALSWNDWSDGDGCGPATPRTSGSRCPASDPMECLWYDPYPAGPTTISTRSHVTPPSSFRRCPPPSVSFSTSREEAEDTPPTKPGDAALVARTIRCRVPEALVVAQRCTAAINPWRPHASTSSSSSSTSIILSSPYVDRNTRTNGLAGPSTRRLRH